MLLRTYGDYSDYLPSGIYVALLAPYQAPGNFVQRRCRVFAVYRYDL